MFRETLDSNSTYAFETVCPTANTAGDTYQYRTATGANAAGSGSTNIDPHTGFVLPGPAIFSPLSGRPMASPGRRMVRPDDPHVHQLLCRSGDHGPFGHQSFDGHLR